MPTQDELRARFEAAQRAGKQPPAADAPPVATDPPSQDDLARRFEAAKAASAPTTNESLGSDIAQKLGEALIPGFNRVTAAVQAAGDPLIPGRTAEWGEDFGTRYAEHLRANQGASAETQRKKPVTSFVTQMVGSAPVAALTAGAGAPVGRVASLLAGAKQGAGLGAAYAAGDTRSDTVAGQLRDILAGAGTGGALGGAFGAAIPGLEGPPMSKADRAIAAGETVDTSPGAIAAWLRKKAGERNIKAAGAVQSDITRSRKQLGPGGKNDGREALTEMGAEMGEKGLVTAGSNPDKTFTRAATLMDDAGNRMGSILADADKSAGESGASPSLGNVLNTLMPALDDLKQNPNPGAQDAASRFEKLLGNYVDILGKDRLSFSEAHKLRRQVDAELYGMRGNKDPWADQFKNALHEVRGAISDEIEQKLGDAIANSAPWRQANRDYQVAAKALEFADKGMDRGHGNNMISPLEWLTFLASSGAGMAGHEGIGLGGIGLTAATMLGRRYGSSGLGAFSLKLSNLLRTNPSVFGQYARPLLNAEAKGGPEALGAAHYVLTQTDPGYRAQLSAAAAQDEGR